MPVKCFREEAGYSLVEVMASIIILAIAILPMVGMFDMGLRTATTGSNYDKARTLANLKMEEAKSLPFATRQRQLPGDRVYPRPHHGLLRFGLYCGNGAGGRRLRELRVQGREAVHGAAAH